MLTKIENWKRTRNGPPMGWGGGVTADDDRGCYDPVDPVWPPRLTPSSMLFNIEFNIEFDVTVFDVPVFDVNCLYQRKEYYKNSFLLLCKVYFNKYLQEACYFRVQKYVRRIIGQNELWKSYCYFSATDSRVFLFCVV